MTRGPVARRVFRMLPPTDTLRAEHALTSSGLAALEAISQHVRAGGSFPAEDVATLLQFLRGFVWSIHMRKEAEVVCPAVAMRGDEAAAETVGELLRLHEEVGELIHSLVLFWEPVGELTRAEQEGFADTVATLSSRARRMQEIEERKLFPACDTTIPADDRLDWPARFEELEAGRTGARAWGKQLAGIVRRWVA